MYQSVANPAPHPRHTPEALPWYGWQAMLAVALAAFTLSADPVMGDGGGWRVLTPGVEHRRVADGDGELWRFDLARFRATVAVSGAARPKTAAVIRRETGAALAVNGGFFDTDWRSLGLRIADGKTVVALRPRVDWGVLVVRDDRAAILHARDFRPDPEITAAIQVGPRLLVAGQPTKLRPQSARRTVVALDRDGRKLTIVATRTAVDAGALAATLAKLGFDSALALDGGPSTQLSAAVADLAIEIPGGYGVPDTLLIRPR